MKIKYRFLLVFILVTIISASVLLVAFDNYRNELQRDVDDTVEQNAQTAATMLDSRLADQQRTVQVVATDSALQAHGDRRQQARLETFLNVSAFSGVSVVDTDGQLTAIAGVDDERRNSLLGKSLGNRQYVQQALAGETYISDPFVAETDNHIVVISTPLVTDDGTVVGSVNAAYHLTDTTLFEPLAANSNETGITVSGNGTVLYSTADGFADSTIRTTSLSMTGWLVTSHYNAAAISQDFRQLAAVQLLVTVLLIGTITGFGIWIYQSEIRHTERLHRRIDNLEARTYEDNVEFSGATEWRDIGRALNQLSTTLARREQMLLVLNRFLRHNLRNELNVAAGYAAEIRRTADSVENRQYAETMEKAVDSVLSTTNRVRLTEKLIAPTAVDGQSVDIVAVLTEQIEQVTTETPELTVTLDAPETVAVGGGETLSFAIEELLSNVAAHGGSNPSAAVTVTTTDETVTVQITDDGPGIHPDEAAIICGSRDITPLQHSSGLGLWLVNWIVRRHNGTLSIPDAEAGTTIEITLPRATKDGQQPEK